MKIDRVVWFAAGMWAKTLVLMVVCMIAPTLRPLYTLSLAVACTLTAVAMIRPHIAAASECVQLGIEIQQRRDRLRRSQVRPVVSPLRRDTEEESAAKRHSGGQ